jgi:hypothetical protein
MNFERPAVFFINGLGDQLIALPTLRALAYLFPGKIQLMLGEGNYGFLFHAIPTASRDPVRLWWTDQSTGTVDVDRILKRAAPCDLFISLSTWNSPSILELVKRMSAQHSLGFFNSFDTVVLQEGRHMFDYLFAIAQELEPSLSLHNFAAAPTFSGPADGAAARFVARNIWPGERLLFVHPETSMIEKIWAPEHFCWVLSRFLAERRDFKAFVSTSTADMLAMCADMDRVILFDEHLELTLATIRYADLFLGLDSCFLHAADLFRVPGVALFGPTHPREWGFRFSPNSRNVYGGGSMQNIRRELVLESLLAVVSENLESSRTGFVNESAGHLTEANRSAYSGRNWLGS